MRCPDCGRDFPVKPEVVIQKESCKCGLTADTRIARYLMVVVIIMIVTLGSCTVVQSFLNARLAEKGDYIGSNGTLEKLKGK
jgi:hypothetical protein